MTSEKIKFLGSTISKLFRYLNKNVIQARIFILCVSLSVLIISCALSLGFVLYTGSMSLQELLILINKIIN